MKYCRILLIMIFLLVLAFTGCKNRNSRLMPDKNQRSTPFVYAPLPPFHQIFQILEYLKLGDYNQAVEEQIFNAKQEIGQSAFALGVLTADGIISVRGHNKSKLNAIAEEMIRISNFLGLDESILRLADQLKDLIADDQWVELEKALEHYKNEVEGTLYQSQQYDQFTMMQVGGWVEGINRISWFVNKNYQVDKTKVLAQKGTLNHLIENMEYINTPSIKDSYYFKNTLEELKKVRQVVENDKNDTYTTEQVSHLMTMTGNIKDLYRK